MHEINDLKKENSKGHDDIKHTEKAQWWVHYHARELHRFQYAMGQSMQYIRLVKEERNDWEEVNEMS